MTADKTAYFNVQTRLPRYYPLPAFLLESDLGSTEKILYAILLERVTLSQKNRWIDEEGRVYILFSEKEMCARLHLGLSTIKTGLSRLEKEGLLVRKRMGAGKPNQLFLKYRTEQQTAGIPTVREPGNHPADGRNADLQRAGIPAPNYLMDEPYKNNRTGGGAPGRTGLFQYDGGEDEWYS